MSIKVPIVSACVFGTALVHGARVFPQGPYCIPANNDIANKDITIRITGKTVKVKNSDESINCEITEEFALDTADHLCKADANAELQLTFGTSTYDGDKDELTTIITVGSGQPLSALTATKCATTTITLPTVTLPTVTAPKTITMPTVTSPPTKAAAPTAPAPTTDEEVPTEGTPAPTGGNTQSSSWMPSLITVAVTVFALLH